MDFHTGLFCVAYGRDMSSPHVRGEYVHIFNRYYFHYGSSPRAWGILVIQGTALTGERFIPTCVGNTCTALKTYMAEKVHPHVRGEYQLSQYVDDFNGGSSPRAWGIPSRTRRDDILRRFIPTCVGNTPATQVKRPPSSVHPHVRGEYGCWRGTSVAPARFIPTCVGNTWPASGQLPCTAVHPHVRGEYCAPSARPIWQPGSSPRAWGILFIDSITSFYNRFIPTCVGNT